MVEIEPTALPPCSSVVTNKVFAAHFAYAVIEELGLTPAPASPRSVVKATLEYQPLNVYPVRVGEGSDTTEPPEI